MWKTILAILIRELIEAVTKAVSDYLKWRKVAKKNKEKANEITKISDAQARAIAMRDFLNK